MPCYYIVENKSADFSPLEMQWVKLKFRHFLVETINLFQLCPIINQGLTADKGTLISKKEIMQHLIFQIFIIF